MAYPASTSSTYETVLFERLLICASFVGWSNGVVIRVGKVAFRSMVWQDDLNNLR
jgi:hypothetical protein